MPGGTHVYCMEPGSDRITYLQDANDWNTVYVSSVIRSFNAQKMPCPVMRIIRELPTEKNLLHFLSTV